MQTDPQITFRGLEPTAALTEAIQGKIAELERTTDRITFCRVTVDRPHMKGRKGHLYHVAVELEMPGGAIHVNRKPGDETAHEDFHVALRDSFAVARRQLDEHLRKMGRVHIKSHPEKATGKVVRLFPDEGYGFVQTLAGEELYFHRDSVLADDWDKLDILSELHFSRMDGEKGPFAVNISVRRP